MFVPADRLIPFLAVAVVLVVTPGPDFAMVTRNALRSGRRGGVMTALGVALGMALWTAASLLGIAAVLRVSALAFTLVKLAGAAYLIFLGARSLVRALRTRSPDHEEELVDPSARSTSAFWQGLMCNVLNPKAAAIFTGVIPQFVVPNAGTDWQLAELGATFVVLVAVWLSLYSTVAAAMGGLARHPRVRRWVDGVTGCALVLFGVRLARAGT